MSELSEKLREWICEHNEEATLLDGYEDAIVGVVDVAGALAPVVAYDGDKCLAILMERDKMSDEDALDYFSYNTMRALPYIHQHTPVIFWRAPA